MKKNSQSLEIVIPKLFPEEKKRNINKLQNIFDLLLVKDKQDNFIHTSTFVFNANDVEEDNFQHHKEQQPSQPLKYQYVDSVSEETSISIDDLHNNDKKILVLLSEEVWSTYSFKAIERKIDIHQQSLSRALKRLVYLNLIEKTPHGYKLKEKNLSQLISIIQKSQLDDEESLTFGTTSKSRTKKRFSQLIQISIPKKSNIDIIVNRLVGKYFGNLRWFGLIKKETGFTLQWTVINKYGNTESNHNNNNLFQINLNIVSEYIVIETDAKSDIEKINAMSYSNRLVEQITKILKSNLKEEEKEYEIPEEFPIANNYSSTHTNKIKYKSNK
jgi:hypothetical protein